MRGEGWGGGGGVERQGDKRGREGREGTLVNVGERR